MATPIITKCDLDFYISAVKTGRLFDLGQLSDAHRSVDAESDIINKINGDVAVYEISYVNTQNLLIGFQFRLPLDRLGLDSTCSSVLGVSSEATAVRLIPHPRFIRLLKIRMVPLIGFYLQRVIS